MLLKEQFAQGLHYLPFHHKISECDHLVIKFWNHSAKTEEVCGTTQPHHWHRKTWWWKEHVEKAIADLFLKYLKNVFQSPQKAQEKNRPWFKNECKEAIKKRKDSLKKFNTQQTTDNLNIAKVMRAQACHTIKYAEQSPWQKYVSKINSRTPMKKYGTKGHYSCLEAIGPSNFLFITTNLFIKL